MHMTDKLCKCSMHCVRNEYYCRIQIRVLMKFMILDTSFTQSTSFVRMVICGCVGFFLKANSQITVFEIKCEFWAVELVPGQIHT